MRVFAGSAVEDATAAAALRAARAAASRALRPSNASAALAPRFHSTRSARCADGSVVLSELRASASADAAACQRACGAHPSCAAATWHRGASWPCRLFSQCLHRIGSPGTVTFHRRLPSWPAGGPAAVRWRGSAALVLASYAGRLNWLAALPAALLDVVVYQKVGGTSRGPDGAGRLQQARTACCAADCSMLAYYALLPNLGRTTGTRGGSREPFAYLSFILDFWANLPRLVIFAQDDCWRSWACQVYRTPREQLSSTLRLALAGAAAPRRPKAESCLCTLNDESFRRVDGAFEGALWPLLQLVWRRFFGISAADDVGRRLTWPQTATFLVSGAHVAARPRRFYRALMRLVTVEGCAGAGSWTWSNAFERLWLDVFDPSLRLRSDAFASEFLC